MTELIRIFRPEAGRCTLVAVSDNWISLSETVEFRGAGELILTLGAGSAAAKAAALGDILLVGGEGFIVEGITRDEKTHEVTLRAPGVLSVLNRCVASVTATETKPAEEAILSLAEEFAGSGLPLPLETEGGDGGDDVVLTPRTEGLFPLLVRLATVGQRGLEMTVSPGDGKLTLMAPAILDRTVGSASPVVLGTDMDTLLDTEETVDLGTYKNGVRVTSSEEVDGAPVTETLTAADCGFGDGWDDGAAGRRDAAVTVSVAKGSFYDDGEFDLDGYRGALRARAREYLAAHRPVVTLSARLPASVSAALSPGDLVSVRTGSGLVSRLVTKKTILRRRGEEICGIVLADASGSGNE